MKPILKIYGLPHSGTNAVYALLNLNFETYTCSTANFGVDYLGWKHGHLMSAEVIEYVKITTGEQPLFVFTYRSYESWSEALARNKHCEFDTDYTDRFVFHTPTGTQVYASCLDYYNALTDSYRMFQAANADISVEVDFDDLRSNQKRLVQTIGDKFNLKRCYNEVVEINKLITGDGMWSSRTNVFYTV